MEVSSSGVCSLCVCGDGSVGKSSIIANFKSNGFVPVYKQTIGVDFFEKLLKIRENLSISLRIWDVGGQSINSNNLSTYLSSSHVVFLVYDVTNAESFANLDDWLRKIREYSTTRHVYLVANKIDIFQSRLITEKQHEEYIIGNDLTGGIFLSAKTGDNVVRSFYEIAGKVCGTPLTQNELSAYDIVVTAHIVKSSDEDEERTPWADEIEAEDRAAEEKRLARANCMCSIS